MSNKKKQHTTNLFRIFFILYMGVLFYFMFFSERYGRTSVSDTYRYNLELFLEIKRFIKYRNVVGAESFVVNILGNVFVFLPIGFLVPIIRKKRLKKQTKNVFTRTMEVMGLLFRVTLISFELSLFIEMTQLITKVGCFDVDDLLMNTIGGMLGCMIYVIGHKLMKRR